MPDDFQTAEERRAEAERLELERQRRAELLANDTDEYHRTAFRQHARETDATASRVTDERITRAQQLALDEERLIAQRERDRLVRATDLAVDAERIRQRMDSTVAEVTTLKAEMIALRTEVAKATVEVGKLGMSMEFLNLRLFGGPSPNDNGEFGKLYEKIGGQAATVIVRYLLGIIAVVIAGALLALLVHGK